MMRLQRLIPLLLTGLLLTGCAADTGVSSRDVTRIVGQVMSSQMRINPSEKLAALAELDAFLLRTRNKSQQVAGALQQLADLYLQIEIQTYEKKRARWLRIPEKERGDPPAINHNRSIRLYSKLLKDYPRRTGTQATYYQLAHIYDNLDQPENQATMLRALIARSPKGERLAEAYYRLAELEFDDGLFKKSADLYEQVIEGRSSKRLKELALYKRTWALYLVPSLDKSAHAGVAFVDAHRVPRGKQMVLDSQSMPEPEWEKVREVMTLLARAIHEGGGVRVLNRYVPESRDYVAEIYRRVGDMAAQVKRPKDAIKTYETFVKRHPLHPRAPMFLGYMVDRYTEIEDIKSAVNTRVRLVNNYSPDSKWWKVQSASTRRRMESVLRDTTQRLALHFHSQAQESKKASDYEEAFSWYRRYLENHPDSTEASRVTFLLAEGTFETGQYEQAAIDYARSAYEFPRGKRSAEAAYAAVYTREKLLGQTKKGSPEYATNLAALNKDMVRLIRHYPREERLPGAYERVSGLLFEARAYDLLYDLTDQLIRNGPRIRELHINAWRALGEAALETGRPKRAEEALTQALSYVTDDPVESERLQRMLAAAAISRMRAESTPEQVKAALGRAQELLQPGDALLASTQVDAGESLARAGDMTGALAAFASFLADNPGHELTDRVARSVINAGEQAMQNGDMPTARLAWKKYRQWFSGRWPDRDRALAQLQAKSYLDEGNLVEAEKAFSALLASYTDDDAPEALVDRVMGIRFKRAAKLIEEGDATGVQLLASIVREQPESRLAAAALNGVVGAASQGVGNQKPNPVQAVEAGWRLLNGYPDSPQAEALRPRFPDLLIAAGQPREAGLLLMSLAEDADDASDTETAQARLIRAAQVFEKGGVNALAIDAFQSLRERFEPGSDPWVEAQTRMIQLRIANTTTPPDRQTSPKQHAAMDKALLAVLTPLADADVLAGSGRKLAGEIWMSRAESARTVFDKIHLVPPLKENLKRKSAAMKKSVAYYKKAMGFRSRGVTTRATRRMGEVLEQFGIALLAAPVPDTLTPEQVKIYQAGLKKKARPYQARAAKAHMSNLKRLRQGVGGADVELSVAALGRLQPKWYDRPEDGAQLIDVP